MFFPNTLNFPIFVAGEIYIAIYSICLNMEFLISWFTGEAITVSQGGEVKTPVLQYHFHEHNVILL